MPYSSPALPGESTLPFPTIGPYRLVSKLGRGGMGAVYLAEHVHLKRRVALKLLNPYWSGEPKAIARFRVEMEACGQFNHPHIIQATDAGESRDCHFLVMEYIAGMDLSRVLRQRGPFSVADACEIARQVSLALKCIDEHGLVHRDIKPSNLLLGKDGLVRVLDLGLARLRIASSDQNFLTDTQQAMGTGDYIAPEQGLDAREVDIRADIYSLGCTIFHLLTGEPPFARSGSGSLQSKIDAHLYQALPPIAISRPDVPPEVVRLLERMLAKNADRRPAKPDELIREFGRFASGSDLRGRIAEAETAVRSNPEMPGALPPTISLPKKNSHRRRNILISIGTVGLLALLLGMFWLKDSTPLPTKALATTKSEPIVENPNLVVFRKSEPVELIDRNPKILLWPKFGPKPQWGNGQLTANCFESGLIELGEMGTQPFEVRMTFLQNQWAGGVGIFFRCRPDEVRPEKDCFTDFILLTPEIKGQERNFGEMYRGYYRYVRGNRGFPLVVFVLPDQFPRPKGTGHTLSMEIDDVGVRLIRLNGERIGQGMSDPSKALPDRKGCYGGVGFYAEESNTTVTSFQVRPIPARGHQP